MTEQAHPSRTRLRPPPPISTQTERRRRGARWRAALAGRALARRAQGVA